MNPYFSLSEKVYDITERYPELIDFLAANGFGKISNPLMRKTIGKQISLEMAFKSRHVDSDAMEKQLVEVIENNANRECPKQFLICLPTSQKRSVQFK